MQTHAFPNGESLYVVHREAQAPEIYRRVAQYAPGWKGDRQLNMDYTDANALNDMLAQGSKVWLAVKPFTPETTYRAFRMAWLWTDDNGKPRYAIVHPDRESPATEGTYRVVNLTTAVESALYTQNEAREIVMLALKGELRGSFDL